MKKMCYRVLPFLLALMMLAGCGAEEKEMDGEAVFSRILAEASFDTELRDAGAAAALYFPQLPEGSQVRLCTGSGYYADELALLTMETAKDADKAMKVVEQHLKELREQFVNYVPEEVPKIENAVTVQSGRQILLCITKDADAVRAITENAAPASQPSDTSKPTEPAGTAASETTVPSQTEASGYPGLHSESGTYHDYGTGVIRVDDRAYELYGFNRSAAEHYTGLVSAVADALSGQVTVYDLAIPTGSGIVLPDDIAEKLPGYTDQGEAIEKIFSMLSDKVVKVSPYENLMRHRDEYLYFHTDYHWNGRGAYYAYEAFCQAKGIAPYPLDQRRQQDFPDFLGALYYNDSGKDPVLAGNPDTVEAFHPHSPNAKMRYTDHKGNTYPWDIIMDVSGWASGSQYSTFAAGDNPYSVFENPDVTDGSVAIVVKESYGNALLPYLCDHYSTIYEIDYRYWEGSLVELAREKNADDLIFANNLSMIGSNLLIGKLANVAK